MNGANPLCLLTLFSSKTASFQALQSASSSTLNNLALSSFLSAMRKGFLMANLLLYPVQEVNEVVHNKTYLSSNLNSTVLTRHNKVKPPAFDGAQCKTKIHLFAGTGNVRYSYFGMKGVLCFFITQLIILILRQNSSSRK